MNVIDLTLRKEKHTIYLMGKDDTGTNEVMKIIYRLRLQRLKGDLINVGI